MDIIQQARQGAAVAELLSSWLAEQEDRGSIPASPLEIVEIGYLLLPSRDMAESSIPLKRRKSSIQPTNQPSTSPAKTQSCGFESHYGQEFFHFVFCRFRRAPGRSTGPMQIKSSMTSIRGI